MSRIGHINLSVSNIERSTQFYDALMFPLGFVRGIDESGDWGAVLGYKGTDIELEIIHENDIEYKEFNRFVGLNHIAIRVDSREKVDEAFEIVKKQGTRITREPRVYTEYEEGYYAFFFRDPDGIPLEVAFY